MIVSVNGEPMTLNCDWLQYSVLLYEAEPELECPSGYRLGIFPGNNIFKHRAILSDDTGEKLATMLWGPYSSKLNSRLMTVQIANRVLYYDGIAEVSRLVERVAPHHYNSMGRIDMALDFNTTPARWDLIRKLSTGAAYVERKGDGAVWFHDEAGSAGHIRVPHCINWGSNKTEIRPKLYNKVRELDPSGRGEWEKPYIVERWEEAGMATRGVWRLEFAMSGVSSLLVRNKPIMLEDVRSSQWLLATMRELIKTRFRLRYNEGLRSRKGNNDPRASLFSLGDDGASIAWVAADERKPTSGTAIKLLRRLLADIEQDTVVANDSLFQSYANTIVTLVDFNHLDSYMCKKTGFNIRDYLTKVYETVGTGKYEEVPKLSQSWD